MTLYMKDGVVAVTANYFIQVMSSDLEKRKEKIVRYGSIFWVAVYGDWVADLIKL